MKFVRELLSKLNPKESGFLHITHGQLRKDVSCLLLALHPMPDRNGEGHNHVL